MLKRIGLVALATVGFSLIAAPAFADPTTPDSSISAAAPKQDPIGEDADFEDAWALFNDAGGAIGWGAATLVSSAYTGLLETPAELTHSFSCGGGCE